MNEGGWSQYSVYTQVKRTPRSLVLSHLLLLALVRMLVGVRWPAPPLLPGWWGGHSTAHRGRCHRLALHRVSDRRDRHRRHRHDWLADCEARSRDGREREEPVLHPPATHMCHTSVSPLPLSTSRAVLTPQHRTDLLGRSLRHLPLLELAPLPLTPAQPAIQRGGAR